MQLVQSSLFAQRLARVLLFGLFLSVAAMAFLPWQQTSRGEGQVVAFRPQDRPQTIDCAVKVGVVAEIGPGMREGAVVEKGDLILRIEPFADNLMEQMEGQRKELEGKLKATNEKIATYELSVIQAELARDAAISSAEQMVESAKAKLQEQREEVTGYEAKIEQLTLNLTRQSKLWEAGITPKKEIEKIEADRNSWIAKLAGLHQKIESLDRDLESKRQDLEDKRASAEAKVLSAKAIVQSEISNAATISKELYELATKQNEMDRFEIRATRAGTIFRMPVFEENMIVKEGDPLVTIVPKDAQIAVELFVNGNDMPLVQPGQEVRLQFEGWPAVQVAGWPSVAVGTFSGQVAVVDPTDNGKGKFRILITPNEAAEDTPWPSDRILRQGVRANGWVMMRQVPLGYEIWRQLNGFPIALSDEPEQKPAKVPKLPK